MTVTRDAPPRAYDCTITAALTTFLLVSFRRTPIWKAIARGHIRRMAAARGSPCDSANSPPALDPSRSPAPGASS